MIRSEIPLGSKFAGDRPMEYIETRLSVTGEKISNAVVMLSNASHFDSVTFDNCVWVCDTFETAQAFQEIAVGIIGDGRVYVGDMDLARALLKFTGDGPNRHWLNRSC